MKAFLLSILILLFLSTLAVVPGHTADCFGQWKRIKNYKKSMGAACQYLGLDTHRGTCQGGKEYETLCDDAADGLYRTCNGPRRCKKKHSPTGGGGGGGGHNCKKWDFYYDRPCPKGFINSDCEGSCEKKRRNNNPPCEKWDYNYNQPCPKGYINHDCRGGCEPRW